ncbi:MAG: hypothetical protein ACI4JQ_05320 [Ruminococcus sp.]
MQFVSLENVPVEHFQQKSRYCCPDDFPEKPKTAALHCRNGCLGKNNEKKEINARDF